MVVMAIVFAGCYFDGGGGVGGGENGDGDKDWSVVGSGITWQ